MQEEKSLHAQKTIKDINAASIVTRIISFSCCHYVTAEALPYSFQVIYSTPTSYGSRIIHLLFSQPY